VPRRRLLTTPQLADELGLSLRSIARYKAAGWITPELTTPGGHARWDPESVRQQLRKVTEQRREDHRRGE
jgi:DNA-binding transcriptional MerR regulator